MNKAPAIDGRLEEGEWAFAMAFSGSALKMDPRRTTVWMGYDKENIYMALQAETPPRGNLVSASKWYNHHDSLELWFAPPQQLRTVESLKFGVFQTIVNFEGKFISEHHNPGYGLTSRDWKHNAAIKSVVVNGQWTMEMAFPLKAMGVEGSPEGDWRILVCRNHGVEPRLQAPMTDAGSFMDPNSYSVFHFSRECMAIQQLYAKGARLPLLFHVANPGEKSLATEIALKLSDGKELSLSQKVEVAPEKSATQDFTQESDAESSKCKVTAKADGWNRAITWVPPEPPIWRNTESFQTLFCGLDAGKKALIDYTTVADAEAKIAPAPEGVLSSVPGPVASRSILDFTGRTVEFPKSKLSSPGAVSFWMRVSAPLPKEKSYRRFFGTIFKSSGYVYFQEQRDGGFLIGAQYFGPENKNGKNLLIGRRPQPGQWMHIAINFQQDCIEVYMNGIRRGAMQHKLDMDLSKAGGALLANASFADFAIYSRPLTAAEITGLSQGDKAVTGTIAWYQSLNSPVVDMVLDCKAAPEKKLQLQIRDEKDKVVESLALDFNAAPSRVENGREMATLHAILPLSKKLADGKYSFFLSKPGSETPVYERAFAVKAYPWLNNSIGKADRLLPGFTPLKRSGNKLSAVLKDVTLGANGLPESVTANGGEVLARPVELVAEAGGKTLAWNCQPLKFTGE
ncbi:MAG: hypothetical protein IJS15_00450, partial [Victivallales bacterium]|nr:hypothetical protein [Victivallales bacterium]